MDEKAVLKLLRESHYEAKEKSQEFKMEEETWDLLDKYRKSSPRIKTRSEAMRDIVILGIELLDPDMFDGRKNELRSTSSKITRQPIRLGLKFIDTVNEYRKQINPAPPFTTMIRWIIKEMLHLWKEERPEE